MGFSQLFMPWDVLFLCAVPNSLLPWCSYRWEPGAPEGIPRKGILPGCCRGQGHRGGGEGLMRAGTGQRAGPWKGMLFVGEEENLSGA